MCACLTETEDECYHAMQEIFKDKFSKNLDNSEATVERCS